MAIENGQIISYNDKKYSVGGVHSHPTNSDDQYVLLIDIDKNARTNEGRKIISLSELEAAATPGKQEKVTAPAPIAEESKPKKDKNKEEKRD